MKKIIATFLLLMTFFLFPVMAFADTGESTGDDDSGVEDIAVEEAPTINVEDAINNVTNWVFVFVLAIAVLFLLIAGFQFITAGGDPDKVSKARMSLFYGLIGVGVAVMAKGLVGFVRGLLGNN